MCGKSSKWPGTKDMDDAAMVPLGEDHREIRDAIRSVCEKYPGSYWRAKWKTPMSIPEKFA